MRSRYTAYFLANAKYIIQTTHPLNIEYTTDTVLWEKDILEFSRNYTFKKLTIIDFDDGKDTAFVTFNATIFQNTYDSSFTEKSMFKKVNKQWLYLSGIHL